ncbi:MAG TPA: hypothetical protein VKA60_07755 [Blastocatellia bacterium]|nr:hypothetical protein [Blastocatellia bacterium]
MKKRLTIIATFSLFAIIGASTARAQVVDGIKADIPFEFTVRNLTLPAGSYTIKPLNSAPGPMMVITTAEGKAMTVFPTMDAQLHQPPRDAELVFHRVGDQYFLYEVFEQGNSLGAMLPRPRAERRLEKEEAVNRDSSYVTVVGLKTTAARR